MSFFSNFGGKNKGKEETIDTSINNILTIANDFESFSGRIIESLMKDNTNKTEKIPFSKKLGDFTFSRNDDSFLLENTQYKLIVDAWGVEYTEYNLEISTNRNYADVRKAKDASEVRTLRYKFHFNNDDESLVFNMTVGEENTSINCHGPAPDNISEKDQQIQDYEAVQTELESKVNKIKKTLLSDLNGFIPKDFA